MARMYFMYNPETITRQYVSYLDQGALDPFNTIYQSGNLVAPPSYMDFSFSLFFDRQQEAMDQTHPGVFVDYQFFDLVVRNVVPVVDPNNNASTQLPDNGVMMVNPRDITVVFSPQITVQGRPSNAQVSFQRFTHRMVPTRMQIDLTMRVVYFGPMKDMVQYARETIDVQSTVHWRDDMGMQLNITNDQIQAWKQNSTEWISGLDSNANATDAQTSLNAQGASSGGASGDLMAKVVAFAIQKGKDNGLTYGGIQHRMNLWKQSDCSSFVWAAFAYYQDPSNSNGNLASKMGWPTPPQNGGQAPSTDAMLLQFRGPSATAHATKLWDVDKSASASTRASQIQAGINQNPFQVGDLIFRERGLNGRDVGHVAFYNGGTSSTINLCDNGGPYGAPFSPSRPTSIAYIEANYNAAYRPLPLGSGMQANAGGN
jgi:hypothetical protein